MLRGTGIDAFHLESAEEVRRSLPIDAESSVIFLLDTHGPLFPLVWEAVQSTDDHLKPYLILLGVEVGNRGAFELLASGADDFITADSDYLELVARLRVASRSLNTRAHIAEQVSMLDSMCRRHNLLGDFVRARCITATSEETRAIEAQPNPAEAKGKQDNGLRDCIQQMAEMFGLANVRVDPGELSVGGPGSEVCVTAGLVLLEPPRFQLLSIAATRASMDALYAHFVGLPPESAEEAMDCLAELLNNIQGAFKTGLASQGEEVLASMIPRASAFETRGPVHPLNAVGESYRISDDGLELELTLLTIPTNLRSKPVASLNPGDVLADDFRLAGSNAAPLLRKATFLTKQQIDQLEDMPAISEVETTVEVVEVCRFQELKLTPERSI